MPQNFYCSFYLKKWACRHRLILLKSLRKKKEQKKAPGPGISTTFCLTHFHFLFPFWLLFKPDNRALPYVEPSSSHLNVFLFQM